jgi:hypothetical protein
MRSLAPPDEHDARQVAVDELGQRAWDALRRGDPETLLYDDVALRALLEPDAATRFAARRSLTDLGSCGTPPGCAGHSDPPTMLASARYVGLCVQGARLEPAGEVLGLKQEAWVLDRVLVIGSLPTGRRVAAWIEGTFVYSTHGFRAIDIERVEEPRWEHTDVEIAPCDLAIRRDTPAIAASGAIP